MPHAPRAVLAFTLATLLLAAATTPPWSALVRPTELGDFACQDHQCGCTAESCRTSCCCFPSIPREGDRRDRNARAKTDGLATQVARLVACEGGFPAWTSSATEAPAEPPQAAFELQALTNDRPLAGLSVIPPSRLADAPPTPPPRFV